MTRTIEVEHAGAVEYLRIPVPEGGGVTVIEGANGKGKSETLDAVDRLAGRNASVPTPSDGYDRGTVKGLGVTVTLGRSTRRTGELEVIGLDSRLSVADLVDPGVKDPLAADDKRVKAALSILQVRPRLEDWLPIAGDSETLSAAVRFEFNRADDVLILAARLKTGLAAVARAAEFDRDREEAALAALESDPAVKCPNDPEPPKSHAQLAADYQAAVNARTELEKQAQKADSADAWRAELETLRGGVADTATLSRQLGNGDKMIADAKAKVAEAQKFLDQLIAEQENTAAEYRRACDAAKQIAALEAKLADTAPPEPGALEKATEAVKAAEQAFSDAETARRSIIDRANAAMLRSTLPGLRQAAKEAREASERPEAILAQLLASRGAGIFIESGRIRVPHKRGKILYADLSTGERWAIAMRILVEGIGRGGLATVPQEAWESLDPANKKAVAKLAAAAGVNIITAACSDDQEVKARVYAG